MKFQLKADCVFEADDIDGAFMTVAKHFRSLAGYGNYDMIESGFMEIKPVGGLDEQRTDTRSASGDG